MTRAGPEHTPPGVAGRADAAARRVAAALAPGPAARVDRLLVELVREAGASAAAVTSERHRGGQQVVASCGYDPPVLDYLASGFLLEPSVVWCCAQQGTVITWRDIAGFTEQPAARTVLQPAGFREGTTMLLSSSTGSTLGVLHVSFADPDLPGWVASLLAETRGSVSAGMAQVLHHDRVALTPREAEVLRLVAGGLTNGEIADALLLSRSTVGTHVEHLLAKLGVSNRVRAAVLAVGWGLTAAPVEPTVRSGRVAT